MSLFTWLFRRNTAESKPKRGVFTDDDRDLSAQIRRDQARMRRMEHELKMREIELDIQERNLAIEERIEALNDQYEPAEMIEEAEENPEKLLMSILLKGFLQKNNGGGISFTPPSKPETVRYTDDTLRSLKSQVPPPLLKKLKKMKDDEIIELARLYKPELLDGLDEETKQRAIAIIRE